MAKVITYDGQNYKVYSGVLNKKTGVINAHNNEISVINDNCIELDRDLYLIAAEAPALKNQSQLLQAIQNTALHHLFVNKSDIGRVINQSGIVVCLLISAVVLFLMVGLNGTLGNIHDSISSLNDKLNQPVKVQLNANQQQPGH